MTCIGLAPFVMRQQTQATVSCVICQLWIVHLKGVNEDAIASTCINTVVNIVPTTRDGSLFLFAEYE
jgi:hypothetical protein